MLNKDPYIVPEEAPLNILNSKSDVCMYNNGKYTKHTRHIAIRVHFIINGEKWKMHKIDWCEGGLQLADIATNNVGENDLNPRMKYIMERIDNWKRKLVQDGFHDTKYSVEQEFCINRLDWINDWNQSIWNVGIKFDTWNNIKTVMF